MAINLVDADRYIHIDTCVSISKMQYLQTLFQAGRIKGNILSQVWWLTPVIPAHWKADVGGDQPGQHGETPSLLKIQKH